MKTKPILFSPPMVAAILNGSKTQTRRIVKKPTDKPYAKVGQVLWVREAWRLLGYNDHEEVLIEFKGGTKLAGDPDLERVDYWAEKCEKLLEQQAKKDNVLADEEAERYTWKNPDLIPWKPSIHMPRDIARIFLKVSNVRMERLQNISEEDCLAEGITRLTKDGNVQKYAVLDKGDHSTTPWRDMEYSAKAAFLKLWEQVNGPDSWDDNPYVHVVEFERCLKPKGF